MIRYEETDGFKKDFKKLLKRFRTLSEDLEVVKRNAIELFHDHKIDNQSVFQIQNLHTEYIKIYKIKKIACKSLKGKGARSGIRVIYAFYVNENKVDLIEIYYKGDKDEMSFNRAKEYIKAVSDRA